MFSAPRASASILKVALLASCLCVFSGCSNDTKQAVVKPRYPTLPPKVVPAYLKGTIYELTDAANTEPMLINNFGLVRLLDGTGDSTASTQVREYIIRQMVKHGFGSKINPGYEDVSPSKALNDPRMAIVRVDALLPPGVRQGQACDVQVSVMPGNNTSSLARGTLYRTDLQPNGANNQQPGVGIDPWAVGEGSIFVNPAYALADPSDPAARASLRTGVILAGAHSIKDRPIYLRLRAPEYRISRVTEQRIQQFFQTRDVAGAKDEGVVALFVPMSYAGDWQHFLGVVQHLYYNWSTDFAVNKSRELAEEAVKPDAPLQNISYAWEGLGKSALPGIIPLLTNERPEVAFAAARAAAFIGDSSAQNALIAMARTPDHPFQVEAVETLGSIPNSPVINQMLRTLLNSQQATVRIAAYRVLSRGTDPDPSIYSRVINNKFILDIVPSSGPPLVYASRRGIPRIAIFGNKPALQLPLTWTAMNSRLLIASGESNKTISIFYRDPIVAKPAPVLAFTDLGDLIARLAGLGAEDAPQVLDFSYGDIVAIVRSLSEAKHVVAMTDGKICAAPFMLQDAAGIENEIASAPVIGADEGRPQGDQPEKIGEPVAPHVEAVKKPGS